MPSLQCVLIWVISYDYKMLDTQGPRKTTAIIPPAITLFYPMLCLHMHRYISYEYVLGTRGPRKMTAIIPPAIMLSFSYNVYACTQVHLV